VANQDSNNIVVFGRDERSGKLKALDRTVQTPSPVCLLFHSAP
jgi:6-phosphogluconolactonase (cycloisomerase 2 family)